MRCLSLTLIFASVSMGQTVGFFHAPVTGTLNSSSSTTLTIQQPASNAATVGFIFAVAQCPGQSFTVDQNYNGAGATTTAATIISLATGSSNTTPKAKAFSASNAGTGLSLSSPISYTSGAIGTFDLTKPGTSLIGAGITKNYNLKITNTGSASCAYTLDVYWSER